jgi:ribosomal protein RSM22 (predicted rRNA methylase)
LQDIKPTAASDKIDNLEVVVESSKIVAKNQDIELFVRQTRQTFGHTLPKDYLTGEEYKLYERLYGTPIRETRPEDVAISRSQVATGTDEDVNGGRRVLLRETEGGKLEEIEYVVQKAVREGDVLPTLTEAQEEFLTVTANSKREYVALMKLQKDFEVASLLQQNMEEANLLPEEDDPIEEPEEEEDPDVEEDEGEPDAMFGAEEDRIVGAPRLHRFTAAGRFKTSPSTIYLPKEDFVTPVESMMGRTSYTHVREAAEKAFGGPGLPYSPATPDSKTHLPMKPMQMEAGHHRMSEIDADAFIATALPGMYATAMSTLVETRKRLGSEWLKGLLTQESGPRVLDVGAGGAALMAWESVLEAEWEGLREKGEVSGRVPYGKKMTVVGSENLRKRVSKFLQNTTFLPRLPDYLHSGEAKGDLLDESGTPQARKLFDVIITSHALLPLDSAHKRKEFVDNLWTMLNPVGGVLIVLEKGHPRGFEAVADVRQRMLDEFIVPPGPQPAPETNPDPLERPKEPGMIVAPCTNHSKCPMYHTPGLSRGRKDFCHFQQRFIRPPFLQRILGATHRNHEDIKFSFVSIRRGEHPNPIVSSAHLGARTTVSPFIQGIEAADLAFSGYKVTEPDSTDAAPPHPLSLPRNILPPIKRRGHVTFDLCTPAGVIERWTVPRSYGQQAYHDARKARWGDLWALGAKTRSSRDVRLGKKNADGQREIEKPSFGKVGKLAKKGVLPKEKTRVIELTAEPGRGIVGAREQGRRQRDVERRTKGGRHQTAEDLLAELGHDDMEGDEDLEDLGLLDGGNRGNAKYKGKRTRGGKGRGEDWDSALERR